MVVGIRLPDVAICHCCSESVVPVLTAVALRQDVNLIRYQEGRFNFVTHSSNVCVMKFQKTKGTNNLSVYIKKM